MKIAVTGGTGFVGSHLAGRLAEEGHEVTLLARGRRSASAQTRMKFAPAGLSEPARLREALAGIDVVAHCAGINREIGEQTYQLVHVKGTRNVVQAAREAGVQKIVFMSFLRARPGCGSAYHESKFEAEQIIRASGLDYTIIKSGMVYGYGDHMLDHLSHSFYTFPVLATVGFRKRAVRPLAVEDLVSVLRAALVEHRLQNQTVALTGPEELSLGEAVLRVARVVDRRILTFPAPVALHYVLAQILEWTMKVPLVAKAQIRILSEDGVEPATPCDPVPNDLRPLRRFNPDQIRKGLPLPGAFGLRDLRCCGSHVD
jgi:uncharacterized protein YbjT (DUF2867 family)